MGWLTLSRHKDQSVVLTLGETRVRVRVQDIKGGVVRLGFDAPRDVAIHREEVQQNVDAGVDYLRCEFEPRGDYVECVRCGTKILHGTDSEPKALRRRCSGVTT